MALKRQNDMLAVFSMASMTDIVFLLLVFFMVTSSFVFPTAIEVDLPQSSQQTPVKPSTRLFIDAHGGYFLQPAEGALTSVPADSLAGAVTAVVAADSTAAIAVFADAEVPYGKVVDVLNVGAENNVKMVLATRTAAPPVPEEGTPAE